MEKIFTKKNSEGLKSSKFVGAYVPTNLYNYLSLYTIVNGVSKTEVLNSVMQNWHDEVAVETTEKQLIQETVEFVLLPKWQALRGKSENVLNNFCTQITEELSKQGLTKSLINNLIKTFRNAANK